MGTRRSKHNKGRKPRYKDFRHSLLPKAVWQLPDDPPTAQEILSRPAYSDGWLLNQRLHWGKEDKQKLKILLEANADCEKSSIALGREPKTIAYKARDLGLKLPPEWSAYLPKPKYIAHPRQPKILLNYPFFINVNKDKDAALLAVHNMVPKGIPDHMRGDICQDILLSILEGKVNLETLQRRPDLVKQHIIAWRKNNLERGGYGMMSLDWFGDDKRSYEEQAAAAQDWHMNEMNNSHAAQEIFSKTYHMPTQIDEVYEREISMHQERLHSNNQFLSRTETINLLEGA